MPGPAAVNPGGKPNTSSKAHVQDLANSGIRRQPGLPQHEEVVPGRAKATPEFTFVEENSDDDEDLRARALQRPARGLARQILMDPGDGMKLSD